MSKFKRSLSILLVLLIISGADFSAAPSVNADAAYVNNKYTAVLRYYDDIQITYTLNYPSGSKLTSIADVPIGGMHKGTVLDLPGPKTGLSGLSKQIYCVDPFVHFHQVVQDMNGSKYAVESHWKDGNSLLVTIDMMGGYVAAAPWTYSGAALLNNSALRWLVVNGYRGDFLKDDDESVASVNRLKGLYGSIGTIDKRIAIMATKVAIWKILAGDGVIINDTNLNATDQKTFESLAVNMIADAKSGRSVGGSSMKAEFTLTVNNPDAYADDGGFRYYGPLTVTAKLDESAGVDGGVIDDVYLTIDGLETSGIAFLDGGSSSAQSLPSGGIYGTGAPAYYLDASGFSASGSGELTSQPFYLKIPLDRDSIINANSPQDMLLIKAFGRAKDVALSGVTPIVYVYEDTEDGDYDWDYVQAFIGASQSGVKTELYAEASINTGVTKLGKIYVSKYVENASQLDVDMLFGFRLLSDGGGGFSAEDLSKYSVSGVAGRDPVGADKGTFTLKNGETVIIDSLPANKAYKVEEVSVDGKSPGSAGFAAPSYAVKRETVTATSNSVGYSTGGFDLTGDGKGGFNAQVSFTNKKADSPSQKKANLYVGKVAVEYTFDAEGGIDQKNAGKNEVFDFLVEKSTVKNGAAKWEPLDISKGNYISDCAVSSDKENGMFKLGPFNYAYMEVDAGIDYRVTEIGCDPKYTVVYVLESYNGNVQTGYDYKKTSSFDDADWHRNGIKYIAQPVAAMSDSYYYYVFSNIGAPIADMAVTKTVKGGTSAQNGETYKIQIYRPDEGFKDAVPLTAKNPADEAFYIEILSGGAVIDASGRLSKAGAGDKYDTVFGIKDGEEAIIYSLPTVNYTVREFPGNDNGYSTSFNIARLGVDAGKTSDVYGASGSYLYKETDKFLLSGSMLVELVNTVSSVTSTPGRKTTPTPTEAPTSTPGKPKKPRDDNPTITPDRTPSVTVTPSAAPVKTPVKTPAKTPGGTSKRTPRPTPNGPAATGATPGGNHPADKPGGDTPTHRPSGGTPSITPSPAKADNMIVAGDGGTYVEVDENGVPLGVWQWDEVKDEWIYEALPSAVDGSHNGPRMPKTGDGGSPPIVLPFAALLLFACAASMRGRLFKRKRN